MKNIKLKKGDFFLSSNPMSLGKIINFFQRMYSKDGRSQYTHAGLIIDENGETIEALGNITTGNLKAYRKDQVLIARHQAMTDERFYQGITYIRSNIGDVYPYHRILFHLWPFLAKRINFDNVVCSELNMKFLKGTGLSNINWSGITPDNIHDIIFDNPNWKIVFSGVLV